jgi:hypothetical protein
MPFSVEHLICRYVQTDRQTDRQTDELIRVGLGNQRFLQVNRQFPVILSFMYYISKNSDSRFTWIHDFEENLTESVGPMPFSAEHLICRYVQTDRRTDELIRVGLGNLRVLQVKRSPPPSRHLRLFWRKKNIKFYFRKKHHTRKNSSVS